MPVKNSENGIKQESRYLDYLPGIYRDDKFLGQYLRIFEDIMVPLENTIDAMAIYFDPIITTEDFVMWMASWLDLARDPTWTLPKWRELVKSAARLYRLRGTRRGLAECLRIYTGSVPEITEFIQGMILSSETKLGVDTKLGSAGTGHHFSVDLVLEADNAVDMETVRSIIDAQKPAHTLYTLHMRRRD